MDKFFIIKSIFSPNNEIFSSTYSSLINLYEQNKLLNIKILLIGWIPDKKNRNKIIKFINNFKHINSYIDFWDKNFGKYYLFNKINNYILNNIILSNNILYFDHDIIIMSLFDMINISSKLIHFKIDDHNIELVVFNQKGDSRHQIEIYNHVTNINETNVLYSKNMNIMSIGMGCFCMSIECFLLCTPMEQISVYGMDDYYICSSVLKNNFNIVITLDISVFHPFHNNKKYKKWKNEMIQKIITKNITFEESIIDSILFFDKNIID